MRRLTKDKKCFEILITLFTLISLILNVKCTVLAATFYDSSSKEIYLTFDDGPSYIVTNEILDILKNKDVKATFFVIGYKIKGREDIMRRIHQEGHTIGLHSFTHSAKKVYANEKSLLTEMEQTCEEIRTVTGISPKAIRFPGGSKPHLNKTLLGKLHEKGYRVYDWNACIPDGIDSKISAEKLTEESKKVIGNDSKVILLLHCDQRNNNTCEALPKIIEFYTQNGYEFKAISDDTPELFFRFKGLNK
jgi:peptidoglycan/xylan/chitin deacetylase (PgdA/CDA1 family)